MTVTDLISDSRVAHVRELKAEIARLKAELAAVRADNSQWQHHFALALAAARDAERVPPPGAIVVIDGWNVVFNSRFKPAAPTTEARRHSRAQVIDFARARAQGRPEDFVWLVFDGHDDNSCVEGNLRISYTGGSGAHRADRLIVDYARVLRFTGRAARMTAVTNDKAFCAELQRLGVSTVTTWEFTDAH